MGRFWNLRTKLVAVLVVVLSGTFLLQSVIHEHNEQQLLLELEKVALDIANETGALIAEHTRTQLARLGAGEVRSVALPAAAPEGTKSPPRNIVFARYVVSQQPPGEGRPATTRARASGERSTATVRARSEQIVIFVDQAFIEEFANTALRMDLRHASERREDPQEVIAKFLRSMQGGELSPPGAPPEFAASSPVAGGEPILTEPAFAPFETLVAEPAAVTATSAPADESAPPILDVTPYIDRVQQLFNSSKRHDLIATVGVFLIGIALAWFLGVRVTRPVDEVVHGFQRLAEGEFDARVPERPGEEFGHLGRQFNAMVERLTEGRELERELSQRERIQHMGDLAAGVAHDVRNPLNAIHLNIGQIRDEFVPAEERSRERFLRFTSDVQREVERLNQLVTNFLSLARPAAREAEPVDPNELADELFRLLRKEATGREVELALELSEGLPPCSWNRQEMKSAFLNIAINALQALAEKGGHLVISTARRTGRHGEELVVAFSDDGPGIPPEDLERVFVPYYTTRMGGTGLGMAIARRTAERHGGRLELRSAVGEGTTVSFLFPCAAGGEAA